MSDAMSYTASDTTSDKMSDLISIKIECDMPYLRAIQQIPGNTATEKISWIGKLASRDQEAAGDRDKVPQELQSLLQVKAAIKKNTSNYQEDIKSALQSEDFMLNQQALKALWFFNGNCKTTINAKYFCDHIFPNVSLKVRTSIINTFTYQLIGKDPAFAEELFIAITSAYDIKIACPLIIACRESFVYDTIVQKKLILSCTIVEKMYHINSNLAARYLELLKPIDKTDDPFAIGIGDYIKILTKLVKKHLESFIKVCITHESSFPYDINLNKTSAKIFLKKATNHLITHPKIFLKILPIKMISADVIEIIFPKILPDKRHNFSITFALEILEFYPRQKKLELLFKSYKDKYGTELLDDLNNVSPELLQILPTEKRIELAHSKKRQDETDTYYCYSISSYKKCWICYYSTKDAIPLIMDSIKKSSEASARADYIGQMLYCCKVNEDDKMLAEILEYIIGRHKNERSTVCVTIMDYFAQIYNDAFFLNEQLQSLIFDMINLFYIKHGFADKRIIASLTQFRLTNNLPINDLMEILIKSNAKTYISFNILEQYPMNERKCLEIIGDILHKNYPPIWANKNNMIKDKMTEQQKSDLTQFIKAMYTFNERCKKFYSNIKPLTITNYPDLLYGVSTILKFNQHNYYRTSINELLKKNEPNLYNNLISNTENSITNLTSYSGLRQLKRNPLYILNNWEEYLEECRKQHYNKNVRRFIRATRWYQDIPIKFAERCINDLNGNDKGDMSSALIILSILLHGDTLTKIIKSLLSNVTKINVSTREDYEVMEAISLCIKYSNPPVSLDVIMELSEGDYFLTTLVALINVSRRSSLNKILPFAKKLILMRVSVQKHGIRLLRLISSMQEYINHLDHFWMTENNRSIRQIIFDAVERLFLKNPCAETWSLYCKIVSTVTIEDSEMLFLTMNLSYILQRQLKSIASDGITQYIVLWFSTITRLYKDAITKEYKENLNKGIGKFVAMLSESVFKFVPDEIADTIIQKYLFHSEDVISSPSRSFALLYLFTENQDKLQTRKEIFMHTIQSAVICRNKPHPMKLHFYPVNNAIYKFIIEFTDKCVHSRYQQSFNPKIADDVSAIYNSFMLPMQDIKSYLMLEYTKLLLKCTSEKIEDNFGLRLGLFVPNLVDIFTPLLVPFMAKTLDEFLTKAYNIETNDNQDTIRLKIMEGLINSKQTPSIVIAVILLSLEKRDNKKYNNLIRTFMTINHPAVITLLHTYLNSEDTHEIDWNKIVGSDSNK